MRPPPLRWHWTCGHGREALGGKGWVRPVSSLGLLTADQVRVLPPTSRYAWFTTRSDLTEATAASAGLDLRGLITCRRWKHRYRVLGHPDLISWVEARRAFPDVTVRALEAAGAEPATWWVTTEATLVVYDPRTIG